AARWTIEDEAEGPVRQMIAATAVTMPPIALLPRQPEFWSAWHDGSVRMAGRARKRQRGRQGLMSSAPGGFPVGVRLDFGVLRDEIASQVSTLGVALFAGPTVTGPKTFSLTAGIEVTKSFKLGPKSVGKARIKIWQNFVGELRTFGSRLVVDVNPVGGP